MPPGRGRNSDVRSREYLTEAEVDKVGPLASAVKYDQGSVAKI
jgi:hypothetical protein